MVFTLSKYHINEGLIYGLRGGNSIFNVSSVSTPTTFEQFSYPEL